jgi:radical SAM protein
MTPSTYTEDDFDISPLMFYYEITQACDLVCEHCRASAKADADPLELQREQSQALIDQVATFPKRPTLVLTGGDPLKRRDLFDLSRHAAGAGLQVALTPSATPLATYEAFAAAKDAGISRLGISLDGADAVVHDAFRGWSGSFDRTLQMLANARRLQLPVQVNTSVTRRNFHQLDEIAELLAEQGIAMWSVFFLIPVGRGLQQQRISADEYEVAFEKLYRHARSKPYGVKTTEAPHYRRYVLQQQGNPLAGPEGKPDGGGYRGHRAPLGVWDGRGVMFVSQIGEIFPAGFLPLCCGRFPENSVVDVYQNHPTFRALREPDAFKGKCGYCEYRRICGGSRARAYAVTGDALESEPDCVYEPEC